MKCAVTRIVPRIAELVQPLGVVADLGHLLIENLEDLLLVGLGVRVNLLARQRLARHIAARRVADQRSEIADEKNHRMPQLLKVPQLAHQHGVPQVQVGSSGIKARLHAQRLARSCGCLPAARAGR